MRNDRLRKCRLVRFQAGHGPRTREHFSPLTPVIISYDLMGVKGGNPPFVAVISISLAALTESRNRESSEAMNAPMPRVNPYAILKKIVPQIGSGDPDRPIVTNWPPALHHSRGIMDELAVDHDRTIGSQPNDFRRLWRQLRQVSIVTDVDAATMFTCIDWRQD